MKNYTENQERIKRAKLRKMQEEEETLDKIPIEVFFMGNVKEMRKTMKELSFSEKGLLYTIEPYVSFKDCCIEFANGRYMNVKQIAEIAGINEKTAQSLIKGLIQKHIIYREKNGRKVRYFANPLLFCRRGKVDKSLRNNMFGEYQIRTKGDIKWKDLKE